MKGILRMCGAAAWLAALLLGGTPASTQSLASLHGNVTDPSGTVVPGATVHLINSANNSDRTALTDQRGSYTFADVAPGTYLVQVEAPGFEKYEQSNLSIVAAANTVLDIKMKIKEVRQNVTVTGQESDQCLAAEARILPDLGPGLRAIRRGPAGNYYALTSPQSVAAIYSADGKRIGQVPAESSRASSPDATIIYGSDLQVDPSGRVYIADRGANAVKIYSANGIMQKKIRVPAPISVEPLPDGDVAVSSLSSDHLVDVYDPARGDVDRSFGDIADPRSAKCDTATLQCTARIYGAVERTPRTPRETLPPQNRSWFYGDSSGNIYINLVDSPAPAFRKYDAYGYLAYESNFASDPRVSGSDNSNWRISPEVRLAGVGTVTTVDDTSQSSSSLNNSTTGDTTSSTDSRLTSGRPAMGGGGMREMEGAGGGGGMHGGGLHGGGVNANRVGFGVRISQRAAATGSKPVIETMGVDPENGEVWATVGGVSRSLR